VSWLVHVLGIDDVAGRWYGFWSGFGGDLAIIGAMVVGGRKLLQSAKAHHVARLAQAERLHLETQATVTAHHNEQAHQLERHHQRLLDAVAATGPVAADARVSAGAGGNPAGAGLAADERMVPPAAATKPRSRKAAAP
jgi:hypothetical protein